MQVTWLPRTRQDIFDSAARQQTNQSIIEPPRCDGSKGLVQRVVLCLCLWAALVATARCDAQAPTLKYRWVYCSFNMQVNANVPVLQGIMQRAKAVGYTGIVLADFKLNILDQVAPNYFTNMAAIKKTARQLKLDLIPGVFPFGYSEGILEHDPNLAEGMPVEHAVFQAHNGQADIVPTPGTQLKDGGFEQSTNNVMTAWNWQDAPGQITFADTTVKHSGNQSLLIQNVGQVDPVNGNGRIEQNVTVRPFQQIHISVWIKTQNFDTPENVRCLALSPGGQVLNYVGWNIKSTQGWTQYDTVFNTLNTTTVGVYFGVWGGQGGQLWFDDAKFEEVGLLNVLRRNACPVVVKGQNGTVYTEGKDYAHVVDPRMGNIPYPGNYEVYHTPPKLQLTTKSRIKEGQQLDVSFYHVITFYQGQVCCCLTDPKIFTILEAQLTRVANLLSPPGYFMNHDEIRDIGWCALCQSENETPGQLLAANVSQCIQLIKKKAPKATVFVWSDMFDPYHNAISDYYLANGTLANSWLGLTPDTVIVNWNYDQALQSLPWFTGLGNPQILAGYYDGSPDTITTWLNEAQGQSVVGVMYTTWIADYSNLEAFAQAAWGG